ncbi:MAG: hypothetical protein J5829_00040 [Lachnospiraceae bacterium]|nr:hypothetical protein [Lachnospiraceae bacterium]
MKNDRPQKPKVILQEIPDPGSSVSSKQAEKIEKASDLNPQMIASALKKWLTEDK